MEYDTKSPGDSCFECIIGDISASLGQSVVTKLKAIYSLTEKLYAGSLHMLVAVSNGKKLPVLIKDVLDQLSTMPKQVEELKLSATYAVEITALSRAKAYQSELDPKEMAGGCPK